MLYEGNCDKVKKLSILLLLPMNIIGTVLISTSNYVMQSVSAPTRQEVNRSHVGGGFRNIGMPTSYDMLVGRPYKSILWWILALTTAPIHLFLNSSIFQHLADEQLWYSDSLERFRARRDMEIVQHHESWKSH
jgi:hypothetical protein